VLSNKQSNCDKVKNMP